MAQSTEILQLREELEHHAKRLKEVESKLENRTQPEMQRFKVNNNGARQPALADTRKFNVVIEGVPNDQNDHLPEYIIELCDVLDMTIYNQDIVDVVRLPRRDPHATRPPPILVSFAKQHVREGLLRKKYRLASKDRFNMVFINPDETEEVRKRKGFYRRVATLAKNDSKEVTYRHNWISIDDTIYRAEEINKIPTKYCPKDFILDNVSPSSYIGTGARPKTYIRPDESQNNPQQQGAASSVQDNSIRPPPKEKIRLTKAGLLFSGPSAFPSNLSPADFIFDKTPYTSTEQGYQHLFASHHLEFDIKK